MQCCSDPGVLRLVPSLCCRLQDVLNGLKALKRVQAANQGHGQCDDYTRTVQQYTLLQKKIKCVAAHRRIHSCSYAHEHIHMRTVLFELIASALAVAIFVKLHNWQ